MSRLRNIPVALFDVFAVHGLLLLQLYETRSTVDAASVCRMSSNASTHCVNRIVRRAFSVFCLWGFPARRTARSPLMRSPQPVRAAGRPGRCRSLCRRRIGSGSRLRLTHFGAGLLQPVAKCRIGFRQWRTRRFLKLGFARFEVRVYFGLMVQIERDCAVDPRGFAEKRTAKCAFQTRSSPLGAFRCIRCIRCA